MQPTGAIRPGGGIVGKLALKDQCTSEFGIFKRAKEGYNGRS